MLQLRFEKPMIMGILNLTPDSFSDGGKFLDPVTALQRIQELQEQGADIIDLGAESTFGAAAQVTAEEEWRRLEPVLTALDFTKTFVSVDTWKADVAEKALQAGAQMINDVTALRGDSGMTEVLLKHQPYVCLMYSAHETPFAQQTNFQYQDVIHTISQFLQRQAQLLLDQGFPRQKIILDPGLGFFVSSDPAVSWEIIDRLGELKSLGFPILISPSLKSFLGGPIESRHHKTLGASEMGLNNGASILRVHDVTGHAALLKHL